MTHPKLILNRIPYYTIHLQIPSSKYAITRSYEFGHYRSFWKVNKDTFFVKASYANMEDSIEMRPKGLLRGHLKISKKSRTPSKSKNWGSYALVKLTFFAKLSKVNYAPNCNLCQMGPIFCTCFELVEWSTSPSHFHLSLSCFYHLFWFLFKLN